MDKTEFSGLLLKSDVRQTISDWCETQPRLFCLPIEQQTYVDALDSLGRARVGDGLVAGEAPVGLEDPAAEDRAVVHVASGASFEMRKG